MPFPKWLWLSPGPTTVRGAIALSDVWFLFEIKEYQGQESVLERWENENPGFSLHREYSCDPLKKLMQYAETMNSLWFFSRGSVSETDSFEEHDKESLCLNKTGSDQSVVYFIPVVLGKNNELQSLPGISVIGNAFNHTSKVEEQGVDQIKEGDRQRVLTVVVPDSFFSSKPDSSAK